MISSEAASMFRNLLDGAGNIVITTHINPDGDAIGSQSYLAQFLRSRGKRVRVVNQDPTPETLLFVEDPEARAERYDRQLHDDLLSDADLLILVDNSAPDRLGRMETIMVAAAGKTLCLDHHPTREAPWAHAINDTEACATTAVIYELTRSCGWRPDLHAAQAIYVGLVTDTGFFRFNSTNARAHVIAAELLNLGVRPDDVYRRIHERNSPAFTRLLGHALTDLRLDAGGAIASVTMTRRLIESLDAASEDPAEITTALLAIDGVKIAALYRELPDGRIKASLRSKGELDVHRLAKEFGGGGHKNASGIVIPGSLDDIVGLVTARAAALVASDRQEPAP
jgi:phosphoesterase RecJ-like protein